MCLVRGQLLYVVHAPSMLWLVMCQFISNRIYGPATAGAGGGNEVRRFSKINPSGNVQSSHGRFDLFGLRRGAQIIYLSCKQVCDRTIQHEMHAKQLNQAR